jgi:hypothetical protein
MFQPVREANSSQQLTRSFTSLISTHSAESKSQRDVFAGAHRRNQVEVLKDHANRKSPVTSHLFLAEWTKGFGGKQHFTLAGMIEPTK